ncbi:MAG TPA: hypothetical protein VGJ60_36440 [Chloroflexota bacterium]
MPEIGVERLTRGDHYSGMYAYYVRAQAQRALGWLHAAVRTCEHAISQLHHMYPGARVPALGIARVGLAEAAWSREGSTPLSSTLPRGRSSASSSATSVGE